MRVADPPAEAPRPLRLGFGAPEPGQPRRDLAILLLAVLLHVLLIALLQLVGPREYGVRPLIDTSALRLESRRDEVAFMIPLAPPTPGAPDAERDLSEDQGRPGLVTPRVVPNFIPPAPAPGDAAPAATGPQPGAAGTAGLSAADRLRMRVSDPRLWGAPPISSPLPKTPIDAVRERIAADLDAWNDSIAAEAAASARATDWTVKGEDGKRWGISPEGIHLGGVTLPMPGGGFGPPMGRRDEIEERMAIDREIGDQADRARIRDTFKERARAIRERKDRERAAKRDEGGSN